MKKIYLSLFLVGGAFSGLNAQVQVAPYSFRTLNQPGNAVEKTQKLAKPTSSVSNKILYFSEDFDIGTTGPAPTAGPTFTTSNGVWTTGGANGSIWKHSFYSTSGEWSANTPNMMSTTQSNGFMLFDSDSVNWVTCAGNQSCYAPYSGDLISPSIDLTGAASALLTMEQNFRWCCTATNGIQVSVSTDNGVTWGTPYDLTGALGANDDYNNSTGGYDIAVNISSQAAGNMVKLKFSWDASAGSSHYFWNFDDINIIDLPTDDIQILASWISGENNGGIEYGRTPQDHQDANWAIGSQIYNFGSNDQTNLMWDANFGSFTSNGTDALLEADSTTIIENLDPLSLTPAVYTGVYTVVSDLETAASPNYANNLGAREFEITVPSSTPASSIYSQDGIGVYTAPVMSSLGTGSFTGGEDGLVAATMYYLKNSGEVSGIRVMLHTTGSNPTVAGGEIYGSIKDTATFWAGDMSSLYNTLPVTLTAANVTAGYVDLYFGSTTIIPAGVYYAAIEMYSNANANDIRIRDDETVAQPYDASAIYIPGDQSYSNGTALGIRLLMGDWGVGIDENNLEGVSVYPNPSEGVITVTNVAGTANTIVVYDMLGQVIATTEASANTTLDLSANGTGMYIVKVSNANGSMIERVVIK